MDCRDTAIIYGGTKITVTILNEEVKLPSKFEVCSVCKGKGTHVNPSIDSQGISAEEFYDDPDFAESYLNGRYDVQCYKCHGKRVVEVVDRERCDPELLKEYDEEQEEEREYRACCEAERRMGA
ncbi:hypothetical protein KAR91_48915 [Candidatus Pacearchaeota archaeon]|nr:hypothetical protein [Candidatus Pacearchaeota archaeon]